MLKKTMSKEKYAIVQKYNNMCKELAILKKERDAIIHETFTNKEEESTASITVRGEGVAFLVERQTSSSISWKGLAESQISSEIIAEHVGEYTKSYDKYLVKL